MKNEFTLAGIGELLWDMFPTHKRMGGAPANFACHCKQLGATAYPVSCIGADPLGQEILEQLRLLKMNTRYVMETGEYRTGTVDVLLVDSKPIYSIHENSAWDHIPNANELKQLAASLDAVCFGSLSQRSGESRGTIRSFLENMPEAAIKIFDVNLRQAFFSKQQIADSLELANVLKLSDEELPVLADYFSLTGDSTEQLLQLREHFDLDLVAYTRDPDGSLLLTAYEMNDFPGCEIRAVDTVGAGDSFTAALCMGRLRNWPLRKVNKFANEVSAFVCMQKGATPTLPPHLVNYEG